MIFLQLYLKTGWITTETRKSTTISNFHEYFLHFILYRFDNFMQLQMPKKHLVQV